MSTTYLPPNAQPSGHSSNNLGQPTSSTGPSAPLLTPLPRSATGSANNSRVCYFFDSDIGNFHYGPSHPMKPTRIRMTHSLVMNYSLYKRLEIYRAKPATKREVSQFHSDEYVEFISRVTPENADSFVREQSKFNVGDDCPIFDGLFEYCSISAGGSMEGAARLSRDKCDIAVNWAGGLHHAKKGEASGFCYINDIVLGILELLRYHPRVLYIDIDVHHGDGVEEAFYTTDRVMTCSFHKYGEFFPGTGELRDIGYGKGKHYSCNFPLRDGITDESYKSVFEPVISKIMEHYQPTAVVLQCGSDSLAGDKLGCFNLSMRGHANCVQFVKSFGLPLLLLGGGGYTMRNVSRAWAYETGLAAGQELSAQIPVSEYYQYFGPDYKLDVRPNNMEDLNGREYLDKIKAQVFENLRHTAHAPSVQGHVEPRMPIDEDLEDPDADEDERDPEIRAARDVKLRDRRIQGEGELSDSEDEGEGGRRDREDHKRRVGIMDPLIRRNGHGNGSANGNGNGKGKGSNGVSRTPSPTFGPSLTGGHTGTTGGKARNGAFFASSSAGEQGRSVTSEEVKPDASSSLVKPGTSVAQTSTAVPATATATTSVQPTTSTTPPGLAGPGSTTTSAEGAKGEKTTTTTTTTTGDVEMADGTK